MHEIQYCDFNKMYFGDLLAEIHFLKKKKSYKGWGGGILRLTKPSLRSYILNFLFYFPFFSCYQNSFKYHYAK